MNTRFEPLLDFELHHAYTAPEPCTDIDVVPTPYCRDSLRDQGMLYRKTKRGFTLLYEIETGANGSKRGPRHPLIGNEKFSFAVRAVNPYFLNFSELPLTPPGQRIYCMHNLNDNCRDGRILLTSDTTALFLSAMDLIELRPQSFQLELETTPPLCRIEIRDEFNRTVFGETVRTAVPLYTYPVDLRGLRPGRFLLLADGSERLRFYADDGLFRDPPIGVIDLYPSPEVPEGSRFRLPDGTISRKKYEGHIDRRQVYWKYWIVMKYQTGFNAADLSISFPDVSVSFERGQAVSLSDSLLAVPFVSSRNIPLQKKTVKGIQLTGKNGGHSVFTIENLPNVSFEGLIPDGEEGRMYSEVYVYI